MDKEKIRSFQIFSIIFTFILGTLLHFTYKWSGQNSYVAIFSAVNESTWEHLKLLFFPMLIVSIIGVLNFKKDLPNLLCSKTAGIITAMAFIVMFFYTYTGILGKNIAIIDIASFFIAAILGEIVAYLLIVNGFKCNNKISVIVLAIVLAMFIIFTFYPPHIGLFRSPV